MSEFNKSVLAIYLYYFLDSIPALNPSEYCKQITIPPQQSDENKNKNIIHNQSVHQRTHFHISDPHASSSGGSNSMKGIDLNNFPPAEDRGFDLNQFPSIENEDININNQRQI